MAGFAVRALAVGTTRPGTRTGISALPLFYPSSEHRHKAAFLAKKVLHKAITAIQIFIGRRFRLKLKNTYQVCKFYYEKGKRKIGRILDYMGFLFYRSKTLIRKHIMLAATRLAKRLHEEKEAGRGYFTKHMKAMLSYIGWFDCTDTYDCYKEHIKPYVKVGKLKKIVSKLDRRKNHEAVERGTVLRAA